uniref:Uncharacterized protein n=1 Tax=Sphaerodactylus townsendi TaxID=933632 RepID=A0ACB8FF76_9SAUR
MEDTLMTVKHSQAARCWSTDAYQDRPGGTETRGSQGMHPSAPLWTPANPSPPPPSEGDAQAAAALPQHAISSYYCNREQQLSRASRQFSVQLKSPAPGQAPPGWREQ